ncbi:unnamed protein product [Notodromas monacha]|uniref:Uncharacterized protein n=1 Tax=Notodromas monacha TaxID=399045 RepID=A0A7R9BRJ2_9CRUS|nr:unnamed protein product [Notodromas monacha]CAG0919487.1 unnamed protein product [Notodromas monacha]
MEKFAREIDLESVGKVLRIEQNLVGDVGCVVWDAALALVKFLDVQKLNPAASETIVDVSGKTIVELGSGTGCVGIAAALLG